MAIAQGTPYSGSAASPAYSGAPAGGVFVPEIWSGKLIEKFYAATVLAAISNTDYEGEIRNMGDKVKIRTKPTIQIKDYTLDMALTVDRPSGTTVELTIDNAKYFNLVLDDIMRLQADMELLSMWSDDAAEQIVEILEGAGPAAHVAVLDGGARRGHVVDPVEQTKQPVDPVERPRHLLRHHGRKRRRFPALLRGPGVADAETSPKPSGLAARRGKRRR